MTLDPGDYYIWVDGYDPGSAGNFSLELICNDPAPATPTPTPTPVGAGDHCDDVVDISSIINAGSFPQQLSGDTTGMANFYELAECSAFGASGPELVYSFTPDMNRSLSLDLCSGVQIMEDPVMYVRTGGTCPGAISFACNDDGCDDPAGLTADLGCRTYLAGVTYYLFVDNYSSNTTSGPFTLTIDECLPLGCLPDSTFSQSAQPATEFWTAGVSDFAAVPASEIYENLPGYYGTVCGLTWWGFNQECCWVQCSKDVNFEITTYTNVGNAPGAVLDSRTVSVTSTDTLLQYGNTTLLQYDAVIAPCLSLNDGWISIRALNDPLAQECLFLWLSSGMGDCMSYQFDGSQLMQQNHDLSLCVVGSLITPTPTPTQAPPTPTPTMTAPPMPTSTPPDPADNCPGEILECGVCVTGSTVGFANNHDCGEGHSGPDVVYQFTLIETTTITLIGEADYDADWSLSSECGATSATLGCWDFYGQHMDPVCSGITHAEFSQLHYQGTLPAGTYSVWVDGYYESSEGNYALELTCDNEPTPTPTATPQPAGPGDNCDLAIDISTAINAGVYPQTIPGDTTGLNNFYALADCSIDGAMGSEQVFRFVPDTDRLVTFSACDVGDSLENAVLYLRSGGTCPGDTQIACDDIGCEVGNPAGAQLSCVSLMAGQEYFLFVDSVAGMMSGTFTLTLEECQEPVCSEDSIWGQVPTGPNEFWEAYFSDDSTASSPVLFENLQGLIGGVCQLTWYGFNLDSSLMQCDKQSDFTIMFYEDNLGMPGTVQASIAVTATSSATGLMFGNFNLWKFTATIDPCVYLNDGWISIQSEWDDMAPDCRFAWLNSMSGDGVSYYWDGSDLIQSDNDWSLCFGGIEGTPTPIPCLNTGDVNGNGSLSAEDAQMAFGIVLGTLIPTYEQECAADCNGDGSVTAEDAQLIFSAVIFGGSCTDPLIP